MALDNSSSSTVTLTCFSASSISIDRIIAGFRASVTNSVKSSLHLMISTFSLFSSLTMFLTLAPLSPTHAPTGSTLGSAE